MNYLVAGIAGLAMVAMSLLSSPADAQLPDGYVPHEGGDVLVYVHLFNPDDYEEGVRLVTEGFGEAMAASGQARHTYFLESPENSEVIAVSFFATEEDVEEWQQSVGRLDILEQLEDLRREPLQVMRYQVHTIHTTN